MRLLQQPLIRQLRHLIANRRRTQSQALTMLQPRNRPRTHRLAGLDIALDNGRQNSPLPRRYPLRIRHSSLRTLKLYAHLKLLSRQRKGIHVTK